MGLCPEGVSEFIAHIGSRSGHCRRCEAWLLQADLVGSHPDLVRAIAAWPLFLASDLAEKGEAEMSDFQPLRILYLGQ